MQGPAAQASSDDGIRYYDLIPRPFGYGPAVDTASGVAAAFLAGASLTIATLALEAEEAAITKEVTVGLLALAVVSFLMTIQFGYWSRMWFSTLDDAAAWYPDRRDEERMQALADEVAVNLTVYWRWVSRARTAYRVGLIALMLGFGGLLWPLIAPVAVVAVALIYELLWIWSARVTGRGTDSGQVPAWLLRLAWTIAPSDPSSKPPTVPSYPPVGPKG